MVLALHDIGINYIRKVENIAGMQSGNDDGQRKTYCKNVVKINQNHDKINVIQLQKVGNQQLNIRLMANAIEEALA